MVIKAIILDLDMTLVNTLPKFLSILRECAARYGRNIDSDINKLLNIYYRDPSLSEVLGDLSRNFWFWHECWALYSMRRDYGEVFPGTLDAVKVLRGMGKRLVIATGRELECSRMMDELRYYGFTEFIEGCVSLGDLGPGHDKLDLVKKALDILRLPPNNVAYVTDHPRDILLVNGLGTINIGVATWARDFPTKFVIRSVAELPRLVAMLDGASD
ncbi:HAD hydrolase-like protein [Vulcanisaeta distributa]|uniref:HAD family hydrolase n=1 Tax=Vulcanisaeta distributa TaxID=164451 RepID=UPI0006D25590|nr:HAD hydrolase-like protein [Vulcanisaeta distributa]